MIQGDLSTDLKETKILFIFYIVVRQIAEHRSNKKSFTNYQRQDLINSEKYLNYVLPARFNQFLINKKLESIFLGNPLSSESAFTIS